MRTARWRLRSGSPGVARKGSAGPPPLGTIARSTSDNAGDQRSDPGIASQAQAVLHRFGRMTDTRRGMPEPRAWISLPRCWNKAGTTARQVPYGILPCASAVLNRRFPPNRTRVKQRQTFRATLAWTPRCAVLTWRRRYAFAATLCMEQRISAGAATGITRHSVLPTSWVDRRNVDMVVA